MTLATIRFVLLCAVALLGCSSSPDSPVSGDEQAGTGAGSAGSQGGNGAGAGGAASGRGAGTGGGGSAAGRAAAGSGGRASASGAGAPASTGDAGAGAAGHVAAAGSGGRAAAAGSGGRDYGSSRDAFFGASRCAVAGVLLCEDFESGAIDTQRWKVESGKPTVEGTQAARGSKALHLHTAATGYAGISTTKVFPAPKNRYYGRMFVYFEALPTGPKYAHWTIVGANGPADGGEIRVGGQYDGKLNRFGVGTDHGPTGDWTNLDEDPKNAAKAVPLNEWVCVEWLHDGSANETSFYWDAVEHASLHTTRDVDYYGSKGVKYDLPTFSSVWVGFWNYDQGQTMTPDHFDVWIDEVAFDDERIGCVL